jgi:hypothetical protein
MGRDVFFDGPEPPPGQVWCAICLGLAKRVVTGAEQEALAAAARGSEDQQPLRINMSKHLLNVELKVAVTRSISTVAPALGALDVCWSHAVGLEPMSGGVALASPQEAAMVNQAAMLNQKRHR